MVAEVERLRAELANHPRCLYSVMAYELDEIAEEMGITLTDKQREFAYDRAAKWLGRDDNETSNRDTIREAIEKSI